MRFILRKAFAKRPTPLYAKLSLLLFNQRYHWNLLNCFRFTLITINIIKRLLIFYTLYLLEIKKTIDEKLIEMGYLNMCLHYDKMEKYWIENFSINTSCRWTCCVMSDNLIVLTHCTDHLRQSFKKQWTHLIESGLWLLYWIILRSNFLIIKFSSLRHQLVIISTYLLNQTQRCLDLNQGLLPI